ncbi:hypothetical protein M434DRAFT_36661 [Hypoxylon sp. CO27-5]|nr:hypothetical protein M434DRAFT_36661 [Hypoxylon sp. CO27-5]
MPVEFTPEHENDSNLHNDITPDIGPNPLLNANLTPFINPHAILLLHLSHRSLVRLIQDPTALVQPPYCGYTTATVSSSRDSPVLLSPSSAISLDEKHDNWGTSYSRRPRLSHCSCLQQQVQLVYQLGELQFSHTGGPTLNIFLSEVQLAQGSWNYLMKCDRCQSRENLKEVFLLFATSIRILLSLFQQLNTSYHKVDIPRHSSMA